MSSSSFSNGWSVPDSIVEWKNGEDGKMKRVRVSVKRQLAPIEIYLDSNYPGQYSVQLKRDLFRITVPRS
ncbi:unnamed protein product [Clonostachys rosea f. rosea IK726]|uniref:Uncharacterized protein n=1 Tax=Clonostachys rosea f. rosea IK726 TaxID=1349383 RepID=A0ACA9UGQ4_BIOOC|nr:unnamed protein product [Clonostachys rosea f. rosea IK726]